MLWAEGTTGAKALGWVRAGLVPFGDIWGCRAGRVGILGRKPDLAIPFAALGDSSSGVKFQPQESLLRLKKMGFYCHLIVALPLKLTPRSQASQLSGTHSLVLDLPPP